MSAANRRPVGGLATVETRVSDAVIEEVDVPIIRGYAKRKRRSSLGPLKETSNREKRAGNGVGGE